MKAITVAGAREHNLKNITVSIPHHRLTVVSGVSGSGKSSLAFDTIFAEGQRRYVESLSSYARQFLGRLDKPDVDYIEGLSPAISIEQKSTNRNPRSTVGTITEISDYYRLLFARIGVPYDPKTGQRIERQSVDEILETLLQTATNSRCMIFAPCVRAQRGQHQKLLQDARKSGYVRVRIDGELFDLEDDIELDKHKKHSIDILVDRLIITAENRKRLVEAVETGLNLANGVISAHTDLDGEKNERSFSLDFAYPDSDIPFPKLEPALFSFNSPYGACPSCSGLGFIREFEPSRIVRNPELSFDEGGFIPYNPESAWYRNYFSSLAEHFNFELSTPIEDIPEDIRKILFYGSDDKITFVYERQNDDSTSRHEYVKQFPGILYNLQERYRQTTSSNIRQWLEGFMSTISCNSCQGMRLRPEPLSILIQGKNIHELSTLSIQDARSFFQELQLSDSERKISKEILREIEHRLEFLHDVGLDYLSMERSAASLSGGEAQRIRLASQIGSALTGVLYVLDEPTIGLHQRDNDRLLRTLFSIRDAGNTILVVEHDEQILRSADYMLDLGPGAGVHGGDLVASGTPEEIIANPKSVTGSYLTDLARKKTYSRRSGNGEELVLSRVRKHNLKNITAKIPLGTLTVVTGVSGSGKSTLLLDVLLPILQEKINKKENKDNIESFYDTIEGVESLDKVMHIDQSPIGRTPRSNPATYVGAFQPIRDLFASLPESRARGYQLGRFSFNVRGGRCEHCQGAGTIRIEMQFLSDVYVVCEICKGKRYTQETLEVDYKGYSIYDVLMMTVEESSHIFSAIPSISRKLETLNSVGLGYITLGQSALTLSGGEAQRVKLALELSKRSTGNTIFIMDEPTTGLHFKDVEQLMKVISDLVEHGNTVVVIEHNLDVIAEADHIIDLGPEGGDRGGELLISGTPETVAAHPDSHTGHYLKEMLNNS